MAVYDAYVRADRLTETRLFLSLIRFNGLQESDAGALSAGEGVNWRHVVRLAKRHGTAPLLYRNVKRLGLGPRLPADVLDGLRVSYLCTAGRNIRLGRKLVRVVDALEDRGIPAAPFKGPVMAQCLYGDLTLRCYGDLDILVPRKAAIDAREAMASMGCRFLGPNIGRHQFGAAQTLEKAFNFTTGDGNVAIDLHWRLNRQVRYAYDYEFCGERLTTATIENREVACLSPEDMVVYLCVHGATH